MHVRVGVSGVEGDRGSECLPSLTMEGGIGMHSTCHLSSEQALCRRTVRRRVLDKQREWEDGGGDRNSKVILEIRERS